MVNDPVADALVRIKNGYLVSAKEVRIPHSKLVLNLCQLLVKAGFLENLEKDGQDIRVVLKYQDRNPAVTDVKRVSKPGLRVYKGVKALPRVLGGLGIAVISTPKGLMTDKEARKSGVGGEVMAFIW